MEKFNFSPFFTDLTDKASFDKTKFWVDQLKSAEPVSAKLGILRTVEMTSVVFLSLSPIHLTMYHFAL